MLITSLRAEEGTESVSVVVGIRFEGTARCRRLYCAVKGILHKYRSGGEVGAMGLL